jgi:tetratricopeptide (TPR) repeat protein
MNPWHTGVLAVTAAAVMVAAQAAPAQMRSDDCRNLVVNVHDTTGIGIPNALVTFDRGWSVATDYDGRAVLDCRPMMRPTIVLEVKAHGFKTVQLIIASDLLINGHDVYLQRDDTSGDIPSSRTVAARELSPEIQKKSAALQEAGVTALSKGDNAEAEKRFRDALALTPSSSSIYNNIGVSYLRRYRFDEAATWFEKAVQTSPYSPQLLGNLGMIRWVQRRYEESYELIERAVTGGFSAPGAHFILGLVSLQKGRLDRAVEQLRKTDPEKYPIRDLFLSIALHAQGKEKAASRSYETFTRISPAPLYSTWLPKLVE